MFCTLLISRYTGIQETVTILIFAVDQNYKFLAVVE